MKAVLSKRYVTLVFACVSLFLAAHSHAQEVNLAVGGNTLWSPKNTTASVGFLPPPLKGGMYPSFSLEYMNENHFGILAEGSFRARYAYYDYSQPYRPFLYDINGVYAAHLAHKTRADFMAGIGAETILFYNATYGCTISTGGCRTFLNSTHFLTHAGVGLRYTVWRNVFVRPEAHWYYVRNNFQFHSNNVFRVGFSVGYTFRPLDEPEPKKK